MKVAILFNQKDNKTFVHKVIETFQGGLLKNAVHAAAILDELHPPTDRGTRRVVLGSSDGERGVHVLPSEIEYGHWQIYDLPNIDLQKVRDWFNEHIGAPYDYLAAASMTCPFFRDQARAWNCSESVCEAIGFTDPSQLPPSVLADICATLGKNVTAEFFGL